MKVIVFPKEINEELAEETGWHIGDGSMNYYQNKRYKSGLYQLRGHIEDDREHYINRIKPLFKNLYGIDISLREMPSTRVFGFQIWSTDLMKFKQSLGLPLGKKYSIKIPDLFLSDKKLTVAVIRGIFDTDGCLYLQKKYGKLYPKVEIRTISKELAEQLHFYFNNFYLRATLNMEKRKIIGNRKVCYSVAIRGVEMLKKFIGLISPKNPKHIRKYEHFKQSFK